MWLILLQETYKFYDSQNSDGIKEGTSSIWSWVRDSKMGL